MLNTLYIQKFHEDRIAKYGSDTPQSLAWFSKEDQLKRFEILTQIGNLDKCTILDIGCGNGDLYDYLSSKYKGFEYFGIDFLSVFLDNAVQKYDHCLNAKFYLGDFMNVTLPKADYIFVSGSLNYKNTDSDFIYKAIAKLYNHCNIALGFNLLSSTLNPDGILMSYSSKSILNFCKTLSKHVILKNDYLENDYTLMMYKKTKNYLKHDFLR